MTGKLQLTFIIGALLYLIVIFWLLKKHRLSVKYAILWLICGFVMLLFALFPYIVYVLRSLTGVQVVSNLIFLMIIAFMMLILLSLTAAVSALAEKLKTLTQANALLEKRLREVEKDSK